MKESSTHTAQRVGGVIYNAVNRDQVDQAATRPEVHKPDFVPATVQFQTEHFSVKGHHRVQIVNSKRDMIDTIGEGSVIST